MNTWRAAFIAGVTAVALAGDADAQDAYVGASVFGDIVRSSNMNDAPFDAAGGEAVGVALRVGTPLGVPWGIEAEFAWPAEIEEEIGPVGFPLIDSVVSVVPAGFSWSSLSGSVVSASPLILPSTYRTRERNVSLSTALWFQQQFTRRFSLVYLGGASFYRTERRLEITYMPRLGIPIVFPPFLSESTIYGVRPMVGVESRIALAERVQLVPGIRMLAGDNTWLVRPAVGVNLMF